MKMVEWYRVLFYVEILSHSDFIFDQNILYNVWPLYDMLTHYCVVKNLIVLNVSLCCKEETFIQGSRNFEANASDLLDT